MKVWIWIKFKVKLALGRLLYKIWGPPLLPNPVMRYPRNTKCFCGGRKRFKHCCERLLPRMVTRKEAKALQKTMDAVAKEVGHDPWNKMPMNYGNVKQ